MNSSSETMLQIARQAKSDAATASAKFNSAQSSIRLKASRRIDLFGGHAVDQLSDIASDIRNSNDEFYSTLQTLVHYVDERCRPLLNQGAEAAAVKEVVAVLKDLNKRSDFGVDLNASVNGGSGFDLANVTYSPSIESRMIEKYWESKFNEMPEAASLKKQEAVRQQTAEDRISEWIHGCDEIWKKRLAFIKELAAEKEAELKRLAEEQRNKTAEELQRQLEEKRAVISQAEQKRAALGLFKLSEKRAQKELIAKTELEIQKLNESLAAAEKQFSDACGEAQRKSMTNVSKLYEKAANQVPYARFPSTRNVGNVHTYFTSTALKVYLMDNRYIDDYYSDAESLTDCLPQSLSIPKRTVSSALMSLVTDGLAEFTYGSEEKEYKLR